MLSSQQISLTLMVVLLPSCLLASPPTISTTLGPAQGLRVNAGDGRATDVFYGIPFAEPPVGELRFKSPRPAQQWEGTLEATTLPNSCWQALDTAYDRMRGVEMWNPNTQRSEDCLYLNIFKPSPDNQGARPTKPIMVWIFGGGFWSGTTTLDVYNATQLAAQNDVIVVSIAYRLGALGFLYLGDSDVPGNAALFDQALALQWVRDNAENLQGSADDITIFGESAGAVSVGFHLLSPLTRDIVKNAIMESSSPIGDWAVQEHDLARNRAEKLAESVQCPTASSEEMVACLRRADPDTLSNNQWNFVESYFDMTFGPVVDGTFLPDHPKDMVARGDIKITDVLMGVNKNEGIYFDIYGFMKDFPLKGDGEISRDQFNRIMNGIAPYQDQVEKVKAEYFKDETLTYTGIIDAVSGDVLFKCPVVDFAQKYVTLGGTVYMYSFEFRMNDLPWPRWMGVPHGYEVEAVFGRPWAARANYTEQERQLSSEIMALWTRFAKTGNPNSRVSVSWPEYSLPEEEYVVFDTQGMQVQRKLRHDQCAFWEELGVV